MKTHAKQSDAATISAGPAPARSPEAANSATAATTTTAAGAKPPAEARSRFVAAVEAIGFWALIVVYMWRVERSAAPGVREAWLVALALIPIGSLLFHRDAPGQLGLRLRPLGRSALEVGIATSVGALLICGVAAGAGSSPPMTRDAWLFLPGYFVWGLLQQLALQAFVHRRLRRALGNPQLAALVTAVLFGSLHLPNPVLAPGTTVVGWIWCRLYARSPNLWTLAASHAVLAGVSLRALPAEWVHNLKVGPGYWEWP